MLTLSPARKPHPSLGYNNTTLVTHLISSENGSRGDENTPFIDDLLESILRPMLEVTVVRAVPPDLTSIVLGLDRDDLPEYTTIYKSFDRLKMWVWRVLLR